MSCLRYLSCVKCPDAFLSQSLRNSRSDPCAYTVVESSTNRLFLKCACGGEGCQQVAVSPSRRVENGFIVVFPLRQLAYFWMNYWRTKVRLLFVFKQTLSWFKEKVDPLSPVPLHPQNGERIVLSLRTQLLDWDTISLLSGHLSVT